MINHKIWNFFWKYQISDHFFKIFGIYIINESIIKERVESINLWIDESIYQSIKSYLFHLLFWIYRVFSDYKVTINILTWFDKL